MYNDNLILHFSEQEQGNFTDMSRWFKGIGMAILFMGILAVILPHIATLTVGVLVGIILFFTGVMHVIHAFQVRKWRSITWEILLSALFLIGGVLFLANPFSGLLALTMLLGFFFLISGSFKVPMALSWRQRPGWGLMLASGVLSIILGIAVIIGLPGTAVWVLGTILGIDLIFTGFTLMILGSKIQEIRG